MLLYETATTALFLIFYIDTNNIRDAAAKEAGPFARVIDKKFKGMVPFGILVQQALLPYRKIDCDDN